MERQLSGVEQAQVELESVMERYEREVDEKIEAMEASGGGDGFGGVREETWVFVP